MRRVIQVTVACMAMVIATSGQVQAALIVNITGTPGDPTLNYSLSGTRLSLTGELQTFASEVTLGNPFQASANPVSVTGTGTITNQTTMTSESISFFRLIDVSPNDFFGVVAQNRMSFTINDVVEFSGSGTFTLPGGMTFSDTTTGTYSWNLFGSGPDDVINITADAPVPEPSTLAVFALGGIGIVAGGIRRRRKQNA